GHSREDLLGVSIHQAHAPLAVELDHRQHVARSPVLAIAAGPSGLARVVVVLRPLDPDPRPREQVDAIGVVPVPVRHDDVGDLLRRDPERPERLVRPGVVRETALDVWRPIAPRIDQDRPSVGALSTQTVIAMSSVRPRSAPWTRLATRKPGIL